MAEHAHRVELVGHRAQEAPLSRHARVVARGLARADVGERLAAVEAVRLAGPDVDRRLRLAPRRPRHLVDQPFLHRDLDASERVDEVGEADQVDHRVVVDPDPEQARDRLLERGRPFLAAAGEAVESVQRLLERLRADPARHLGEIARDPERCGASRAVLDRGENDRVGACAPVAGAFVGSEEQDRRPRVRLGRLLVGQNARVGLERRHLAGAEPLDERQLPRVLRNPLRQRHDNVREEHVAPVTGRAARFLVRKDVLEHAVATDGQVSSSDVGSRGERNEDGKPGRPAAARGVHDREEPEGEQREVDGEDGRHQPPVDTPDGIHGDPGGDDESREEQGAGDPEQDEPPPSCAHVELAGSREHHGEETGNEASTRRRGHRSSVRASSGRGTDFVSERLAGGPCR